MATPRSTTSWSIFTRGLARTLDELAEGEFLIISRRRINHFVQFASGGDEGIRAEAVNNTYIEPLHAVLTVEQYEAMDALGWQRATQQPPELVEGDNPPGSPNFFRNIECWQSRDDLAAVATATLRDVYGVSSPRRLVFEAFHRDWGPIDCPHLPIEPRGQRA